MGRGSPWRAVGGDGRGAPKEGIGGLRGGGFLTPPTQNAPHPNNPNTTQKIPHWKRFIHRAGYALVYARTTAVATSTAEATETLLGSTARRLPRPATAYPGPSLPTTHPGGALGGLGTHGSAGGGRWQRRSVTLLPG